MTNDDFLRTLQQTWQSQDHGATEVLQRLRRKRWEPHIGLAAAMLVCAVALLCGAWFAWIALHPGPLRLLYALSSAVLLISTPAVVIAVIRAVRSSLAWDEEPQALLRIGIRRAEGTLSVFRIQRRLIGVFAAFLALLWICQAAGLLHVTGFLVFYTVFCVVWCGAFWLSMMWQEPRTRGERDACIRLLALMDDTDEGAAQQPDVREHWV